MMTNIVVRAKNVKFENGNVLQIAIDWDKIKAKVNLEEAAALQ